MVIATRPGSRTRVAGIIRFMVLLGPGRHGGRNVCKPEEESQELSPMEHRTLVLLFGSFGLDEINVRLRRFLGFT